VLVEPVIGDRDVEVVPAGPVVALVASDKQDRLAGSVEGEEHPYFRSTRRAGPELLHVLVPTAHDRVDERAPERRADAAENTNAGKQGLGVGLVESVGPALTGGMELDLPGSPLHLLDNNSVI